METLLADVMGRDRMGRSGQKRVQEHFLVFVQLCDWFRLLAEGVTEETRPTTGKAC
jgi:hypothetical protein